jgi:hypothetical protein
MATTQCPACRQTVPYFCCEGLVCPACGYDEEQDFSPAPPATSEKASKISARQPLPTDSRAPQPPLR